MDPVSLRTLYDHHAWALDRLLASALDVPQEDAARPWGAVGSLVDILDHAVTAEYGWLARFRTRERPRWAGAQTVEAVQDRWTVAQAEMRLFLADLQPGDLARPLPRYPNPGDRRNLGEAITHMLLHGAQHTAETAELLTQLGHSPGQLDYMAFLDERESAISPLPRK